MTVRALAITALLAAVILGAGLWYLERIEIYRVRIGAGNEGSEAFAIISALTKSIREYRPQIQAEVVETLGSGQSMRLLGEG